ncbi:hypothetical protein CYMTET_8247 [Cymbomonas tetramitiformis]|uniref:Uncharacterized protein n=1 Tax=Cymbomonas tetramitiformis TaxID=36881 RepID=A0AAE0GTT1_9CHLO|nr:hypothetical protein CYMTET_8247 [Cymbomonas tetramitiformis]
MATIEVDLQAVIEERDAFKHKFAQAQETISVERNSSIEREEYLTQRQEGLEQIVHLLNQKCDETEVKQKEEHSKVLMLERERAQLRKVLGTKPDEDLWHAVATLQQEHNKALEREADLLQKLEEASITFDQKEQELERASTTAELFRVREESKVNLLRMRQAHERSMKEKDKEVIALRNAVELQTFEIAYLRNQVIASGVLDGPKGLQKSTTSALSQLESAVDSVDEEGSSFSKSQPCLGDFSQLGALL